ncbi:MAG: hypothetical protein ACOC56_01805 [Atribacterota bacterium]
MRLEQYLTESKENKIEEIKSILKKNCMGFINEISKGDRLLYRSVKKDIKHYRIIIPRRNRIPLDTSLTLHNMADKLFKKKFGWKVRSEGVFTKRIEDTFYGTPYIFFPLGKYKYVWSDLVVDFSYELGDIYSKYKKSKGKREYSTLKDRMIEVESILTSNSDESKELLDIYKKELKKIVDSYTDSNIEHSGFKEVAFKCDKYMLVNEDYYDIIISHVKQKGKML